MTHIEVVSGTSDGAVTAPTVEGYRFVCWVACVSVGWVGIYPRRITAFQRRKRLGFSRREAA